MVVDNFTEIMTEIFVLRERKGLADGPPRKNGQTKGERLGPWPPPRSIAASKKGHSIHYIVRVKVSNNKNTPKLDFCTTTTIPPVL